jgi:hypothetical protein
MSFWPPHSPRRRAHALTIVVVCFAASTGPIIGGPNREPAVGLRGHGHSGKQEHNWALPQAARDVRALLEQLDLHDVMLAATTGRSGAALAGFGRRTRCRAGETVTCSPGSSAVRSERLAPARERHRTSVPLAGTTRTFVGGRSRPRHSLRWAAPAS